MGALKRSHSAILPAILTALLGTAFALAKTGRDSLFIQSAVVENLPFAYFSIAAATFPAAYFYVKLIELFGAHAARSILFLLTVAVQIFFATTPIRWPLRLDCLLCINPNSLRPAVCESVASHSRSFS